MRDEMKGALRWLALFGIVCGIWAWQRLSRSSLIETRQ
jgi:hypothetical protein